MIAKLTGLVESRGSDWLVLDVNGVGYLVAVASRTLDQCPLAERVSLIIETRLSEEKIQLFGFSSQAERDLFRLLQTVQGVGARLALAIIGSFDLASLQRAILSEDRTALTRAPGVGAKLATRLISELRDKFAGFAGVSGGVGDSPPMATNQNSTFAKADAASEALSALVNLGYGRSLAFGAVAEAQKSLLRDGGAAAVTTAALIRQALAQLNRSPNDSSSDRGA
ncbi:MAG: Holliday junction branch migration protein RuvA [Candidatus Pacebacteria bacterium]|nr:Holliday junction branch migration protein RuvA [Candidatus Paceibacterota bacterium]